MLVKKETGSKASSHTTTTVSVAQGVKSLSSVSSIEDSDFAVAPKAPSTAIQTDVKARPTV